MEETMVSYLSSFPQAFQMAIIIFLMIFVVGVLVVLLIAVIGLLKKDIKWGKVEITTPEEEQKKEVKRGGTRKRKNK